MELDEWHAEVQKRQVLCGPACKIGNCQRREESVGSGILARNNPRIGAPRSHYRGAPKWRAIVALLLIMFFAQSALAESLGSTGSSLENTALWTKIVGGLLGAVLTIIGIPAAFLQFSKTRAEIQKLRLENSKLASEIFPQKKSKTSDRLSVAGERNLRYVGEYMDVIPIVSAPLLVIVDFVVSYILFEGYRVLFRLVPFSGGLWYLIEASILTVAFLVLFVPVYLNARQARLLLREVAQSRRQVRK